MAKKTKTLVLDDDPLAWLNEDPSSEANASTINDMNEKPKKKSASTKKKTASTKKAASTKKKAVAKKKKAAKKTASVKQSKKNSDVTTKPEDEAKLVKEAEAAITNHKEIKPEVDNSTPEPIATSDASFGFFADDENGVAETADDLFASKDDANEESNDVGSFNDSEQGEEAVNTETLDIDKSKIISLGSELTIKTVESIKTQIDDSLLVDDDVVMNAEEMIKIDTAGLQLLFSLKSSLDKTGHHIKWVGTSSVINDSAEVIGFPVLAPKSKEACYGFFADEEAEKEADDGFGFF